MTASKRLARADIDARSLEVSGYVDNPLQLCAQALARMPSRIVPNFQVSCVFGAIEGEPMRYRATLLAPVIERTRPVLPRRTDFKRLAIIAESADGHRALFSWMELFHTCVGPGVFVAYDCDEAPFAPRTGRFALLSLHDDFTGPRHVRDLVRIRVQRIW